MAVDLGIHTRSRVHKGAALALLTVFVTGSAGAADPCQGVAIRDKVAHPMTALARPALGQAVTDPQFGTTIRRITAAGDGQYLVPMYSTIQAWNTDESRLILYRVGQGHKLYDGRTYAFIRDLFGSIAPSDIEHVMWHPTDPDVLYFPSFYTGLPNLYRMQVSTNTVTTVRNFETAPTACRRNLDELSMGHAQFYPGLKVGLQCGDKKFVYDIATNVVHTPRTFSGVTTAPIVGASGTLAYFEGKVYDLELNQLRTLDIVNTTEHACIGKSGLAAAHDVYNSVDFDGSDPGVILSHDLNTGVKKGVISQSTGWPYPPSGTHVSSISVAAPGWAVASTTGDTSGQANLSLELLLANVDSNAFCRVAHHRSFGRNGSVGYWAEPHPVLSPRGTRILFGSDWGNSGSVDSYVVELPSYGQNTTDADLAVTMTDSPDPVAAGSNVTYTIGVTNNGPQNASGVTLVDTLPAGMTLVSTTPACSASGQTVTCPLGSLNASASTSVQVVASAATGGSYLNQASVSGTQPDANTANNAASQTTTVQPTLTIGDVTVTEGNSGTTAATFTVTLSASSSQTVTVNWATANNTASAGSDYTAGSGQLSFSPGSLTRTLGVNVTGDTTSEPDESFWVNLSNAAGATLADGQGRGTIANDDAAASLAVNPTTVPGGQTVTVTVSNGPGNATDWVALHTTSAADTTYLDWKYLNGTRTAPAAGVTSATLSFTMPTTPGSYNFRFFANGGSTKLATSPTVTVQDPPPALSVTPASLSFGSVTTGTSADRALTVTNTGGGTLTGAATASGAGFSIVGSASYALTAAQSATITVRFLPTATGTASGSVALTGGGGTTVAASGTGVAPVASVVPSATTVGPGLPVSTAVTSGPTPSATDWVGLYATTANDTQLLDWKYLNGQRTPPPAALPGATLNFTMPLGAGSYNFRLFAANSYTKLATSGTVTVQQSTVTALSLSVVSANPGQPVQVGVSAGPGNTRDWVGLFTTTGNDTQLLDWKYLNGLRTPPSSGLTTATLGFNAPGTVGSYNFRLFANDSYSRLATSPTLTVAATAASVVPSPAAATAGQALSVAVSGSSGNAAAWVGLFRSTDGDGAALDWKYLNNTRSQPTTGVTSATLTFAAPVASGNYQLRLFRDGGYVRLATGALVVGSASIAATPTSLSAGQTITVTIVGAPGEATSWVALYAVASGDTNPIDWKYLNGLRTPPATGLTTATVTFQAPAAPGTYDVRLFRDGGYQRLAVSAAVTVQ